MRKGSKKATTSGVNTTEETTGEKGGKTANLIVRERELRAQASTLGAKRAQLVLKQRCGTISASERIELLTAHLDFGAVRLEQGHGAMADDIYQAAFGLSRDLLRSGQTLESLQLLIGRLPRDMQKTLTAVPAPAPVVPLPAPEPAAVTAYRAPRAIRSVTPLHTVPGRGRGRPSKYNRSLSG